ncbi:bifunctional hydroxymethylpyrimidine kinase/phosphomethylpyrimidine kinase, partial [Myxococcota bacterium]|nr:bifunctional hydroxymethylpyrimidine kinase/phosphomethylpyrimidine kinase [Myxococcota bacterium]
SGAGVSADIKTALRAGVYAAGVVTSITAQNTSKFISATAVTPEIVSNQLMAIEQDFDIGAIKLSLTGGGENLPVIIHFLRNHSQIPVVWDPVISSTTGGILSTVSQNWEELLSLCSVVTPNCSEIVKIINEYPGDPEKSASVLSEKYRSKVLLKSVPNHPAGTDILFSGENRIIFTSNINDTREIHGTGCALSTLIACTLISENNLSKAVETAKKTLGKMRENVFRPSHGSYLFK